LTKDKNLNPGKNEQRSTKKSQRRLLAIMGPTASGKTALAIRLAKEFQTEIISVDSRQFYREMNIGTAKPDPAQLSEVKHHFINNLSVTETYSAGHFARDAQAVIHDLFNTHQTVIAVGGSTLYYKALLEGIDEFPEILPEARIRVKEIELQSGLSGLQNALNQTDPDYFAEADKDNPRRLIRALEVSWSGVHPYSYYLNRKQYTPDYQIVKLVLNINRKKLYHQIDLRCDEMIANGLLEEVKALYPYRNLKPLHTVGYSEFFEYMDGSYSLSEAVSLFKQHTRNYAKRQMTWLRREEGLVWIDDFDELIKRLKN
jgi:tRNA dimethylallyltransferase